MSKLDALIVGAGPAGMSAALWAWDLKLRVEVFDGGPAPGGQLHRVHNPVADYPGPEAPSGAGIARAFAEHLERHAIHVRTRVQVEAIDAARRAIVIGGERVEAENIVLAMGVRKRRLNVPGESELAGRGVCPSASKHAAEFVGKRVLVVGGGDAALEEALILAKACEHVTLAHRGNEFRGRPDFVARVAADPKIDVRFETRVLAIEGADRVAGAALAYDGVTNHLAAEGVFVCVGVEPSTECVRGQLELDERGFVKVDFARRASAPGIYAVGDVCSGSSWTIAGAVGDGAAAIKDVSRRLSARS